VDGPIGHWRSASRLGPLPNVAKSSQSERDRMGARMAAVFFEPKEKKEEDMPSVN
jgi:hypothetical protein